MTPVPAATSLTIGDDGTGLSAPALGWLHVNCGVTCHNSNPAAEGNGAGMLLRLDPAQLDGRAPDPHTWDILKTTVNVPCVSGSLVGVPRIRPGNMVASAIHQVINQRGALQMPPIASKIVDKPDVAIVAAWIASMTTDGGAPTDGGPIPDGGFHIPDGGFHFDGGSSEAGSPEAGLIDAGVDAVVDAADATVTTGDDEDSDGGDEGGE